MIGPRRCRTTSPSKASLLGRSTRPDDSGQSLVLFSACLVAIMGLVGLATDAGKLLVTRADLQKTVDAAAFAGAQDLPSQGAALSSAQAYVKANGGESTSAEVAFGTMDGTPGAPTIRVTARQRVDYTFLRLLGLGGASVSATATVAVQTVTGYVFDETDIFPYAVWGGGRETGEQSNCAYGICGGSEQVFRSNHYDSDSEVASPDWDVAGNNFKGYFHAQGEVAQLDPFTLQTFSKGGNAIGEEPIAQLKEHARSGRPIILPVISAATCSGGCDEIKVKIVAWVALKLDKDFDANPNKAWEGTVAAPGYAISKGITTGGNEPPATLQTRTFKLVE